MVDGQGRRGERVFQSTVRNQQSTIGHDSPV
jgi:hypothetical protein